MTFIMAQPPLPFPQPEESLPKRFDEGAQPKPKPEPPKPERDERKTLPDVTQGTTEDGESTMPFEPPE